MKKYKFTNGENVFTAYAELSPVGAYWYVYSEDVKNEANHTGALSASHWKAEEVISLPSKRGAVISIGDPAQNDDYWLPEPDFNWVTPGGDLYSQKEMRSAAGKYGFTVIFEGID